MISSPARTDDHNHYSENDQTSNWMSPIGPIGLIAHQLSPDFSDSVNYFLRHRRSLTVLDRPELEKEAGYLRQDYRISVSTPRFSSGEGRAVLNSSVRGHDLFIITDVLNDDCTYIRRGVQVSLSPDEQYRDLLRIILAASGKARRINVIMPYLYEGRQYRRTNRESLDCAAVLQQLYRYGIENLITFDAHDSRIANAVPTRGLENMDTSYQLLESLLQTVPDLSLDAADFMVVSPDEAGVKRAMYYASMLGVPLGIFYRQRDYHRQVDGQYPITGENFLGENLDGRDVLIVDDMLVTGKTLLRVASALKAKGARRIYCAVSFAQFTDGLEELQDAYRRGLFDRIFTTNLIHLQPQAKAAAWLTEVSLSRYIALLIDAVNHDASLARLSTPTAKIRKLLDFHKRQQSYTTGV